MPTYDLAQPGQLEEALDVFDELVLKPRAGHGGVGVLIAPRASREEIEATREAVIADPGAWIAQRMVMLSTHPTVVEGGRLAPRHIDLRPFVFLGEGCNPRVLPGGLTRVARSEGALVVNSSQNGGAKDTWVLPLRRRAPSRAALRDRANGGSAGTPGRARAARRRAGRDVSRPPYAGQLTTPPPASGNAPPGTRGTTVSLPDRVDLAWRASLGVASGERERSACRAPASPAQSARPTVIAAWPTPAPGHGFLDAAAAGVLAVHAARSQRPAKPRRTRPRRSSSARPARAERASSA